MLLTKCFQVMDCLLKEKNFGKADRQAGVLSQTSETRRPWAFPSRPVTSSVRTCGSHHVSPPLQHEVLSSLRHFTKTMRF